MLDRDEIERRAYDLYEQRGREDGHDWDDWLRAETELGGDEVTERRAVAETSLAAAAETELRENDAPAERPAVAETSQAAPRRRRSEHAEAVSAP